VSQLASYKLIIEDDEGRRSVVPVDLQAGQGEITIGRHENNTIRLKERNVSRRHAAIRTSEAGLIAEDLGSANGLWLNGARVQGKADLHSGDVLRIGDYQLSTRAQARKCGGPSHFGGACTHVIDNTGPSTRC
jgi:ABC transport system ATP-binding/permease protein